MLEGRRERQPLAEVLERLVGCEAGPERGDLEQHARRLAEIDRLEVEPVDHGCWVQAGRGHALLPGLVLLDRRCPGDMVDGAGAGDRGRLPVDDALVEPAAVITARLPAAAPRMVEAERLLEQAATPLEDAG